MRSWVRKHAGLYFAAVAIVSGIVTLVGWATPPLRNWLIDHGGLGWAAAVIAVAVGAVSWAVSDRNIAEREHEVDQLTAQADTDRARIADLEARPTERDRQQFQELTDVLFPWSKAGSPIVWLEVGFDAKQWQSERSRALHLFVDQWREAFFDDPVVNEAFGAFYEAVRELVNWMGLKSFPAENTDFQFVPDGHERSGGWPEFDAVREVGLKAADKILTTRQDFERVGRARRL